MRVVFMGTPDFAATILRALDEQHEIIAVYTVPDRPAGRGRSLRASPTRRAADELGLPVRQPATLRDPAELEWLTAAQPDVIVVAAHGMLLPPEILGVPPLGCINVHASLLPRHRGAAPIQRAILEDDDVTGVSIMLMEVTLDTGPVAERVSVPVDEHTTSSLAAELARIGAAALIRTLARAQDGTVVWTPQDDAQATYAPKVTADDVSLNPALSTAEARRRIRASDFHAASRIRIGDRQVTVCEAIPVPEQAAPGSVVPSRRGLLLGFADGALAITRLRPAGKGDMDGAAFVCGARLEPSCTWGPLS